MKRSLAVKASVSRLTDQVAKLDAKVKGYKVKHGKLKSLVEQALSYRHRLEQVVKAVAGRDGTCWCGVVEGSRLTTGSVLHTVACDDLFLVLYGAERGE